MCLNYINKQSHSKLKKMKMSTNLLKINEIYYSIQGESTLSGTRCIFIRLTYCNLRCSYCDSEYTFHEGEDMTISEIINEIKQYDCNLVEVTGGEPLFQKGCNNLLQELVNHNYQVMLETGGSLSLSNTPIEVKKIVDFKCPSSLMDKKNLWEIIDNLTNNDEVKFVIGDENDFKWSLNKIEKYNLDKKCQILFSCVYNKLEYKTLTKWILDSNVNARYQIQLHKHIWPEESKGV